MTRKGGGERLEKVERRKTLPERTTHVGPLVVGNQSHKSVKGSLPNCAKVLYRRTAIQAARG